MPVVLKEFLAGVKTEGVVSMVRQHTISDWGRDPDAKIQKARAAAEESRGGSLKSSGEFLIHSVRVQSILKEKFSVISPRQI